MSAELLTNFQPNSYETKTTVISRRATRAADEPAASLIGALASNCRKSPLLSCVMGATLVASMFNTILLSFVIKSLQLHDKGFIDGKISWSEQMAGTVFGLPTGLRADKSISLNSIESHKDKPLKFLVSDHRAQVTDNQHRVFLSTGDITGPSAKLNYMAASRVSEKDAEQQQADGGRYVRKSSTLEIGARLLRLSLIDANSPLNKSATSNNGNQLRNVNSNSNSNNKLLLEFDDESGSVELALEKELRLHPDEAASSITLESALASDNIVGSSEDTLRVQTREGNLVAKCRDSLEFVSKSASVKVTTLEELALTSPSISLTSGQGIYMTNGIEYFDSEPTDDDRPANGKESTRESDLFAYDLHLLADGSLRAEAVH